MPIASLDILNPGLCTTVQDMGRYGYEHLGVPTAGAMDKEAMAIANMLVGNTIDQPVIECIQIGCAFRLTGSPMIVALACQGQIQIRGAKDMDIPAFQSVWAQPGDTIETRGLQGAACLAIGGAVDVPPVMGSRSTYLRGGLGGFHGRALKCGDQLAVTIPVEPRPELQLPIDQALKDRLFSKRLRAVQGPQAHHFDNDVLDRFFSEHYTITQASDRMGGRLDGRELRHNEMGFNIPSDAIALGSVQVPGDGLPIVLGVDRQITGGYPKIATVISADMGLFARCQPGDKINFEAVEKEEAEAIYCDHQAWLSRINQALAIRSSGDQVIDTEALWSENLISGVVGPDQ